MAISEDGKRLYVDATYPDNPIGITLYEIMKCLGYYKRDTNGNRNLGMIIKNAQINPFAKFKPVRYNLNDYAPLEEYEFLGMASDNENGIFFGIKPNVEITGTVTSDAVAIHTAGVDYYRPDGATYPFRLRDFDGYRHDAKPVPSATLPSSGTYNDAEWDGGGYSGIVISDIGQNTDDFDSVNLLYLFNADEIDSVYPCALLTDANGNSYITALDHKGLVSSDSPAPTPLINGTTGTWSLRLQKPIYGGTAYPWTTEQSDMKLSLCLLRGGTSQGVQPPYIGDSGDTVSLDYNWLPLTSNKVMSSYNKIIPLFGALNQTISLTRLSELPGYCIHTSSSATTTTGIILSLGYTGEYSDKTLSVTVIMKIVRSYSETYTLTKTISVVPSSSAAVSILSVNFTASELTSAGVPLVANTLLNIMPLKITTSLGDDSHTETKASINVTVEQGVST